MQKKVIFNALVRSFVLWFFRQKLTETTIIKKRNNREPIIPKLYKILKYVLSVPTPPEAPADAIPLPNSDKLNILTEFVMFSICPTVDPSLKKLENFDKSKEKSIKITPKTIISKDIIGFFFALLTM